MKKLIALLLAMLLVLVNVAALAEEPDVTSGMSDLVKGTRSTTANGTASAPVFTKSYVMTGNTNTDTTVMTFTETLEFDVEQDKTTYQVDGPTLTVGDNKDNKDTVTMPGTTNIKINIADAKWTKAGIFEYKITEKAPTAANKVEGSDYYAADTTKNQIVHVRVYVVYTDDDGDPTTPLVLTPTANVWVTTYQDKQKRDTITNNYKLGNLTVEKEIDGTLADPNKPFTIKVTFTKTGKIETPISINVSGVTTSKETQTPVTWTGNQGTATLKLCGGDTVVFNDIPVGITFKVQEEGITDLTSDAEQIASVNDPDAYAITYSKAGGDTTVTVTNENKNTDGVSGTISTTNTTAIINNVKSITPPTGITLETLPYVLILVMAMMGVAVITLRKRENY